MNRLLIVFSFILSVQPALARDLSEKELNTYGLLIAQLDMCANILSGNKAIFMEGVSANLRNNIVSSGYGRELGEITDNPIIKDTVSNHTIDTCTRMYERIQNPTK